MADNKEHDFEGLSEIDRLKESNPKKNEPSNSDVGIPENEPYFGDLDNLEIDDAEPSFGDLNDINIDDNIPSFANEPPMTDEQLNSYAELMAYQNHEDEFEHDMSGFEFDGAAPYQPPYSDTPQHEQHQPEPVQEEVPVESQPEPVQEEAPAEPQPEPAQEEAPVETQPEPVQEAPTEPQSEPTQEEAPVETQPEPVQEAPTEPQSEPTQEEAPVETEPEPAEKDLEQGEIPVAAESYADEVLASAAAAVSSVNSETKVGENPEPQKEESELENNKMSENKSFADFSEENAALDSYVNEVVNNKFEDLTRDELKAVGQYKDGELNQLTIDYLKTKKAMENSNGFDIQGFEEIHSYQMAELYLKEIESKKEYKERLDKLLQATVLNNKEAFEDPDLDEDKAIHVFKRIFETVQMSDDFKDVRDAVDNKVKSQDVIADLEAAGFNSDQISKLQNITNAEYSLKLAKAYSTEIEGQDPAKFSEMLKGAKGSILGFLQNPNTGLALSSLAFTSALATGGALPLAIAGARLVSKMADHPQVSGMFNALGDKIIEAADKVGVDAKPAVGMFKKVLGATQKVMKSKAFMAVAILGGGLTAYSMSDNVQELVDNSASSLMKRFSDGSDLEDVQRAALNGDDLPEPSEPASSNVEENSVDSNQTEQQVNTDAPNNAEPDKAQASTVDDSTKASPDNAQASAVDDSTKDSPDNAVEKATLSADASALKDKLMSAKNMVTQYMNDGIEIPTDSLSTLGITQSDLSSLNIGVNDILELRDNPESLVKLLESKAESLQAATPDASVTDAVSGASVDDAAASVADKADSVAPVVPEHLEVTVGKGDSVWSLASDHLKNQLGEAPTDRQIMSLINDLGMDDPNNVHPGDVIKFPSGDLTQYEAQNITKVEHQAWQKDVGKVDVTFEEVTKEQIASVDSSAVLDEVASTVTGKTLSDYYEQQVVDIMQKDYVAFRNANPEFIDNVVNAKSQDDIYKLIEPGMEFDDGNGGTVSLPSLEDAMSTLAFGDDVPAYLDKSALIEKIDAANPDVDFDQRNRYDFIGVTGNENVIGDSANGIENFNLNALDTNFTASNTEFNVSHSINGANTHGLETKVLETMYDGNIPELLDRKAVINDLSASNPELKDALTSRERGYVSIDIKVPESMGLNPASPAPQELTVTTTEVASKSNINQNYLDELRERNKGSDLTI